MQESPRLLGIEGPKMYPDLKEIIPSKKRPTCRDHLTVILAEFFGTSILVFLSCTGSCVGMQGDSMSSMHTSFTAGLAVAAVIQIFAHVSGAHVNPAVSINALILNQITWYYFPSYFIAQVLGSLAGAGLFYIVTKREYLGIQSNGHGMCVNSLSDYISPLQGFMVEICLSIILNLAICASWDARNSNKLDSVSLKIGLLVVVLNLGGVAYTGASMNPSRSFGPAVLSGDYQHHWIYWFGPIIGAIIASIMYKLFFADKKREGLVGIHPYEKNITSQTREDMKGQRT
ncbi:aquaporin AQPAe.a-like isoform X2 [Euwallacea fornicatus]|uniref:aquaporin AQPAe.a-like isoform X2 n=1 Tax=Euwallacea fornicatus TaxID=995702 RepID=UPI00338EEB4E